MKPLLSYTIWFSQRTGSTLLCKALEATGLAGKPNEWLLAQEASYLLAQYGVRDYAELQAHLWKLGSTSNRVFGLKFSLYEPYFSELLEILRQFPGSPQGNYPRTAIWEAAFPNNHHIFMTRRNKVRLAVSWWKAIQTQEWRRQQGSPAQPVDLVEAYSFEAINHLYLESVMREAGIEAFFAEAGIIPLTVVYEDFIRDYEGTLKWVLAYLEIDPTGVTIAPPYYEPLVDSLSEAWVQRFRDERQQGWRNRGW